MAGAGAKLFASGDVLTADQVNTYLMDQTIMKFASTSARDAAFGGAGEPTLAEGMFAYTTDTNTLWLYTGATDGWVNVLGSDIGQQALSNRNVVINGAMQIAQRGTSTASITAADVFVVDRFATNLSALGTWTMSQESDAPTGSGLRKSLKMLVTTADASPAAGDFAAIKTGLEGQNLQQFLKGTASAKAFTMTLWVKSGTTGTFIAELVDADNTRFCSQSYTVNAANTWEKKTLTFPADTTGAFDNDNALSLAIVFYLAAGSTRNSGTLQTTWGTSSTTNRATGQVNLAAAAVAETNYWQITGVQLEAGAVATPFEFEDYGVTLAKCQRYFQRHTAGTAYGVFGIGIAVSTTLIPCYVDSIVPFRTVPSSVTVSNVGVYDGVNAVLAATNAAIIQTSTKGTVIDITVASGGVQFRPYYLGANNNTAGYIQLNAEL